MARNNNNAGMHMIYWPKQKASYEDFEDDYSMCSYKKYNTNEYQKYMEESILKSVRACRGSHTYLCDCYGQHKACFCSGRLQYKKNILVRFYFEGSLVYREVPGLRCEDCSDVFLVKDAIIPLLKYDFCF